eukprot:NODE_1741_length_497_cov_1665.473214_g1663_i0.p2 GENE.NODE_1741_length_497_cov_1665.473214_g1663_i0~~NODE_1741_length_497_cov_1665.473214_g1663_i0.p2  ORF type:complete len:95 (-),score=15.61 NODE_1741_length_497_cov_1665.473214_g1663_i0:145-429(-)
MSEAPVSGGFSPYVATVYPGNTLYSDWNPFEPQPPQLYAHHMKPDGTCVQNVEGDGTPGMCWYQGAGNLERGAALDGISTWSGPGSKILLNSPA